MKTNCTTKSLLTCLLALGLFMLAGCKTDIAHLEEKRDVDRLIRTLDNEDPAVVIAAAEALGRIGDPAAVEPLSGKIYSTGYQSVTLAVVKVLGQFDDPRAVDQIIGVLRNDVQIVRETATTALVQIGAPAVVPLVAVLSHTNDMQINGAVDALVQMGDAAVEPLLDAIQEGSGYSREKVAEVLEEIGWQPGKDEAGAYYWIAKQEWEECAGIGAPAVGPLITIFTQEDLEYRDLVAYALSLIGDEQSVEPLITVLSTNSSWELRAAAAEALGRIGDERAVEPLLAALKDEYMEVRDPVVKALDLMGAPLLSELAQTLNALTPVCSQEVGVDMASLKGGIPGWFYPLVVLDSNGQVNEFTPVFLLRGEPDSPGGSLLVACVDQTYIRM
jgi:hypothetical protein